MDSQPVAARVVKARGPDWLVTAATAARRFYLEGRSKVEIAEELGVSRFQVARVLDEAQRLGIVRVSIELPSALDATLSDALQRRLGVRRVIVVDVPQQAEAATREAIGTVLAGLLAEVVEPGQSLGVACSPTTGRWSRRWASWRPARSCRSAARWPAPTRTWVARRS